VTTNSSTTAFKIIVDADSCPVKGVIIKVARDTSVPVLVIASIAHRIAAETGEISVIEVDNVPQAADIAVINNTSAGDIVVTGDFGLASIVLSRGAVPLSPRGYVFNEKNIDRLLLQRHIDAKIRRGGGRTKGPRSFCLEDRENFEKALRRIIDGRILLNNENKKAADLEEG